MSGNVDSPKLPGDSRRGGRGASRSLKSSSGGGGGKAKTTTVATQIVDMPAMNFLSNLAGSGEEDHLMTHAEEFLLEAATEEEEIKSGSTLQTFNRTDDVIGSGGTKNSVNPLIVPQLNQPTSRISKRSRV